MAKYTVHMLLVGTDAAETRWFKRTLNPLRTGAAAAGLQWHFERATNLHAAAKFLAGGKVDIILIGLRSSRNHASNHLQKLREMSPHTPIIGAVDLENERTLNTACALAAVNLTNRKSPGAPASNLSVLLPGRPGHGAPEEIQKLTPRELQIFRLIAEGHSTKQVAEHLHISVKTAETHRTNLMRKLGLRSVSQVVRFAIRHKVVEA